MRQLRKCSLHRHSPRSAATQETPPTLYTDAERAVISEYIKLVGALEHHDNPLLKELCDVILERVSNIVSGAGRLHWLSDEQIFEAINAMSKAEPNG